MNFFQSITTYAAAEAAFVSSNNIVTRTRSDVDTIT